MEQEAQSEAEELETLRAFRDAMVTLSVTDYFSGRLSGFCERDEDDEDHDDAWDIAASMIQPIIQAEDRAEGRNVWVADDEDEDGEL